MVDSTGDLDNLLNGDDDEENPTSPEDRLEEISPSTPREIMNEYTDKLMKMQASTSFHDAFFKVMALQCFKNLLQNATNPDEIKESVVTSWKDAMLLDIDMVAKIYAATYTKDQVMRSAGGDSPGDIKAMLLTMLHDMENTMRKMMDTI